MSAATSRPPFDQFLAAAEVAIRDRPNVDADMIREIFEETATMIDNSLALDDLDEHDTNAAVALLCIDLVTDDPGAAIRARSEAVLTTPGELHDSQAVSAALLVVTAILRI
jgi:hypothetical protein